MYGLPHAALIANELLKKRLNKHWYCQSKLVSGLWKHNWHPIWFTLVVDDFRVKYVGKEHALHLQSTIESYYPLNWDYANKKVHLSMPGYVATALKLFQHTRPTAPQHSPFPTKPIIYGAKKQYATEALKSPPLDRKGFSSVVPSTQPYSAPSVPLPHNLPALHKTCYHTRCNS
ncbi:hypothetical protein ACHAW6_011919 [Cyclotella cf. meneghiniana]